MQKKVFLIVLISAQSAHGFWNWFQYDRAIADAQKGNLPRAQERLQKEIINHPDDARMLYDAGVISSAQKEYSKALAYFEQAAQQKTAPDVLKVQSLFNAGNMQVELNELKKAVAAYEDALKIEPNNEQVKHNLEIVKKMLEQQDQNQDQQNNENNDQQHNKDDQKDQKGDQEQQNQDKQKGSDNKDQQGDKDDSSEGDEKDDQSGADQDTEDQKESGEKDQNSQDESSESGEQSEKQGQSSEEKAGNASEQAEGTPLEKPLNIDEELIQLLQAQEKQDAALNKQMMKMRVQGSDKEKSEKHNW